MVLTQIVKTVNARLAGELLTFSAMVSLLDEVIDDINEKLNSTYPTFTDFTQAAYPDKYPNYDFFPDRYIRKVVIYGTAFKFYINDEEGITTAQQYGYDYNDALFMMQRDFLEQVPEEFQANCSGSVVLPSFQSDPDYVSYATNFTNWGDI